MRYQLRSRNLGPPGNFQWLVDNARGDYVLVIGDDDHLMPGTPEILTSGIGPEVVVSFDRRHIIDEQRTATAALCAFGNTRPKAFLAAGSFPNMRSPVDA